MFTRFLLDTLKKRRKAFPVSLLVGPRQTGKTTLVKKLQKELEIDYTSFDDINNLIGVELDPVGFLNNLNKPIILDEIQRAPEIFLPIKVDVDNNRIAGRYLLTGSANPLLIPKVGDALTGRMAICNMWPLSQGEILGVKEEFLNTLFSEKNWPKSYPKFSQQDLIITCLIGGFPALQGVSEEERRIWCNNYLSLTLQKDINDLSKIEGFAHIPALMYALASRVGSTLNIEELSRIAKASSTSVRRYLQLLENLFLLYKLPAWSLNIDKRLTKSPKVYYSDTAFLTHILSLNKKLLEEGLKVLGHIVENFVIMEIVKEVSWWDCEVRLSHFRYEKEKGTEVDLVLESEGKVAGIEIKLSSVVRQDDIKGLDALKELSKKKFHRGIILYMGDRILHLKERIQAIPINALWHTV